MVLPLKNDTAREEARELRSYKKIALIAALVAGVLTAALVVLAHIDFLGGMVLTQLDKAVTNQLHVELSSSPLSGNPLLGFKGRDLELTRSGDQLLHVGEYRIHLSYPSIMSGSPRVAKLIIKGLSTDVDSINSLLPKTKSGGKTEIPIDEIVVDDTRVGTAYGLLEINDSRVKLRNTEWFDFDVAGSLAGHSLALSGVCEQKEGLWSCRGFKARLDDGSLALDGAVWPSPDLRLEAKELNLNTVVSLLPQYKKYGVGGVLTASTTLRGTGRELSAKGSGSLSDALVRGVPLKGIKASWNYDKGLAEVELQDSQVFKSSLKGHFKYDSRTAAKYLEVKADVRDLRFADWNSRFDNETQGTTKYLQGGIASLKVDLKGPLDSLVGSAELASSDVSFHKMRFTNLAGKAVFSGGPSGSVDFSALHNGKKITLSGKCSFAKDTPTDLKLHAGRIVLDGLEEAVPQLKGGGVKGELALDASLAGYTGQWTLKADASSPSIAAAKLGTLRNLKASGAYYFKDKSLLLKNASAVWNDARLAAKGKVKTVNGRQNLDFTAEFANADTKKLSGALPVLYKTLEIDAVASGSAHITGTAGSPLVTGHVGAVNCRYRAQHVDKFTADLKYENRKIFLDPMNVEEGGGKGFLRCFVGLAPAGSKADPKWAVAGKLADADLSLMNGILKMSQDIGGRCSGEMRVANEGRGFVWSADIAEGAPRWQKYSLSSVSGDVFGTKSEVNLKGVKFSYFRGSHELNGKVSIPDRGDARDAALDLTIKSERINLYEVLRKNLESVRGVQGLAKSTVRITGTAAKPRFSGSGVLAPLRCRGFMLPMMDLEFDGGLSGINVKRAEARLHDGVIAGQGKVYLKKDKWYTDLHAYGKNVDLRQIAAYLPEKMRDGLGGAVDFKVDGGGFIDKFEARGSLSAQTARFLGVRVTDLHAPFYVSDGYAVMEDVKAACDGGTLGGGAAYDFKKSMWGGNFTALSVDVSEFKQQALPQLKGSITGKADFKVRAGGESGRLSTVRGGGVLFMDKGQIASFDALDAARKYIGGKPLRFDKVRTSFTFDGGNLTILPGSQATAPRGDSVYRSVMVDGTLYHDKKLSFFAMGRVNIRALNALLGAFQGLIKIGTDYNSGTTIDSAELIQNFLGGVLSGYAKNDFRFVSMNFGGSLDAPTYSNIKVDRTVKRKSGDSVIPKSAGDPDEKILEDGDMTFRLKFEIPVGPGTSDSPEGYMKGQAAEQAISNLLKGLNLGGGN